MKILQQEIFFIIKEIINKWDPIGLLDDGAPDDEYSYEILRIVNKITKYNSADDLSNYIYKLFLKMFGDEVNSKAKEKTECDKLLNAYFIKFKIKWEISINFIFY